MRRRLNCPTDVAVAHCRLRFRDDILRPQQHHLHTTEEGREGMGKQTVKRLCGWLALGVSAGILATGCGTVHVAVPVQRPAEINMAKFKDVLIYRIDGNRGNAFADGLKERLISSGRFNVVDRTSMQPILTELQLSQSDLAQSDKAAKVASIQTASAMIKGRVDGSYDEKVTYSDQRVYRDKNDKVGYNVRTYTRTGTVNTGGSIDVIDVVTSKVLKSMNQGNRCQAQTSAERDPRPEAIDRNGLFSACTSKNLDAFMKAISPWTEYVRAPFRTDGDIPMLEAGVNKAKVGDMPGAADTFQEAAKSAEMNPKIKPKTIAKAYFNMGLANQYSDRHDKAMEAFNKAYSLDPSADCAEQMAICKRLRAEKAKLDEQNQ